MPDWDRPNLAGWLAALDGAVAATATSILVAHSLGCLAVAHWARRTERARRAVRAAMLVAPPDVERTDVPPELAGFAPVPVEPLPFRCVVVASRTDPWVVYGRAREWARAWGATLVDAGEAGHLNTEAGFGPWPEGEALLEGLRGSP